MNSTAPDLSIIYNLSTGNVTFWLWDFGDSTTSQEKNPKHTYGRQVKYTVKLTVTNGYGTNSETKSTISQFLKNKY